MPITDLLERNSKLYGEEIALVEINPEIQEEPRVTWREYALIQPTSSTPYRREITWSVFDEKANRVANMLLSRGLKKGQKVAILLMNCLEWLPIYFGILKAGAIAVPLNFRYTAQEIEYCVKLADVDVLFFGPEFIGRVEDIVPSIGRDRLLFFVGETCPSFAEDYHRATANCSSAAPKVLVDDEDEAAIYYSSGTTGFPKAILLKHQALLQAARMEAIHHATTHEDVFLCIPPLYHTGAKMHWFGSLFTGSKAVLLKGNTPQAIFDAVSQERCTIVWLLVPWCQDILAALDRGDLKIEEYQLSQWRLMHIGAQPVPPSLIKHWLSYFPHHKYDTNYGLSESTGPGCVHLGMDNIGKVGAIGVPGYGWKVKIVDEQDQVVPQGEVGELCVKGPGVMVCYYHDPQATAAVLKDGWLHTGDMARQDAEGFYYLVDRKKDVIISGGENLYPVQIEDFLAAYPKIHDVAVIGLPDKRLGEIAAAIIQLKDGMTCTESEINQFCMDLPRYKRPRKIIFADVPRNPTGKIEKPKLREKYCGVRLVEAQAQG
ncbi:long-chain fatty acid--CoA ligase [Pseudoflavonifractor sp. AF19-9AC]|uniref:class I adenylate-forming enzyme family protein n=1 Tax=Pseudoflavonifractor sp. AF19-9AC TaxID=2292244 RepID=UPI000E518AED|nr:class I adenylate-forming enzyme family protein [Pseudoflavonifractor sp. AF19-9AC]RHR10642.1 long-chain fatty acid--CoA ligase [Pseudoflavonifractor sp. AF19-9AC]